MPLVSYPKNHCKSNVKKHWSYVFFPELCWFWSDIGLIFMYGVKQGSSFILLIWIHSFSSTICWKADCASFHGTLNYTSVTWFDLKIMPGKYNRYFDFFIFKCMSLLLKLNPLPKSHNWLVAEQGLKLWTEQCSSFPPDHIFLNFLIGYCWGWEWEGIAKLKSRRKVYKAQTTYINQKFSFCALVSLDIQWDC